MFVFEIKSAKKLKQQCMRNITVCKSKINIVLKTLFWKIISTKCSNYKRKSIINCSQRMYMNVMHTCIFQLLFCAIYGLKFKTVCILEMNMARQLLRCNSKVKLSSISLCCCALLSYFEFSHVSSYGGRPTLGLSGDLKVKLIFRYFKILYQHISKQ